MTKIRRIRQTQMMIAQLRTLPQCPGVAAEIDNLERLIKLLRMGK